MSDYLRNTPADARNFRMRTASAVLGAVSLVSTLACGTSSQPDNRTDVQRAVATLTAAAKTPEAIGTPTPKPTETFAPTATATLIPRSGACSVSVEVMAFQYAPDVTKDPNARRINPNSLVIVTDLPQFGVARVSIPEDPKNPNSPIINSVSQNLDPAGDHSAALIPLKNQVCNDVVNGAPGINVKVSFDNDPIDNCGITPTKPTYSTSIHNGGIGYVVGGRMATPQTQTSVINNRGITGLDNVGTRVSQILAALRVKPGFTIPANNRTANLENLRANQKQLLEAFTSTNKKEVECATPRVTPSATSVVPSK